MGTKTLLKLFLIILFSLLISTYTAAQGGRGRARVAGVVEDEEGNPIKSAKIVMYFIQNEQVKQETTTDKKGKWGIIGLGTGDWRVTASADGYLSTEKNVYIRQLEKNPKITLTLKKIKRDEESIIEDEASFDLLDKGSRLYDERKYDEAIEACLQFLEKNPAAYQAHLSIGDCYREKKEFDKALEEYNIVLEQAQQDDIMGKEMAGKALASIGDIHMKKGDLEEAQNFFKQSIETNPENEILAYNVGEIYFSNKEIDEAIHYFELAIQIKPDWSEPYLKLGYVYLNKADNAKAIENFERFLKLEPDSERSTNVRNIINYLKK
jgi:tetratricopeptide (TPR) repeat protein